MTTMRMMLLLMMVGVMLGLSSVPLGAQAVAPEHKAGDEQGAHPPSLGKSPPRSSELETLYAAKYRKSVEVETERVEQSFDALYTGIVIVLGLILLLALYALFQTYRQATELRRIAALLKEE